MLGTLDFTSLEHWAHSIFPTAQPCSGMLSNQHLPAPDLKREVKTQHKMASKQQAIDHARKYHIIMLFLCHPKMLHKHCFQFHFNSQDKLLWSGQLQQHFAKNQATAYTSHEVPLIEKYAICEILRAFYFKTRIGAQTLTWKSFFILMEIKLIFTRKVLHLASF